MAESEKSGLSNESPESTPQANADAVVEKAETKVENTEDRIRELEKRLTKEGRTTKAQQQEMDVLKTDLQKHKDAFTEAKKVNAQWREWYLKNHASDAEKQAAKAQEEAEKSRSNSGSTADIWKEIAMEDDPKVKKALVKLAKESEKAGESVTKSQIKALKSSFESDEETKEEEDPAKVTAGRTTGTTSQTWDEKMKVAKAAKNTTDIMNLLAEKQLAENSRGR